MNNVAIIKGNSSVYFELEKNTTDGANEPLNPTAKFACKGVTITRETKPFLNRVKDKISENKAVFMVFTILAITGITVATIMFVAPYIAGNNNDNTNNSNYSPTTEASITSNSSAIEAITTNDSPTIEASSTGKWVPMRHGGNNFPVKASDQEQHRYKTCREFIPDEIQCRESTMLSRVWEQRTKDIVVEDGNELIMLCKQRRRDGCNIVSRPKDFGLKE
jgi:hypothetical protein